MNSDTKKESRRLGRTITLVILVAAVIVCAYSSYNIVVILAEDASSHEATEAARSFTRIVQPQEIQPAAPALPAESPSEPVRSSLQPAATSPYLAVDFDGLAGINRDIRAWIDIPGTDISYPVVQTTDDSYYLSHSFDLKENRAGSIFFDSRADSTLSGANTIIYGHRMNNGSMFGKLHLLADADYRQEHGYIHLYLPGSSLPLTYQIFATWESPSALDSLAYQVDFADGTAYQQWLDDLQDKSFVSGLVLAPDDRILTLSTCVQGDGDTRFIVAARLLG